MFIKLACQAVWCPRGYYYFKNSSPQIQGNTVILSNAWLRANNRIGIAFKWSHGSKEKAVEERWVLIFFNEWKRHKMAEFCGAADCGRLDVHHSWHKGYVMSLAFVWEMLTLHVELCLEGLELPFCFLHIQRWLKGPRDIMETWIDYIVLDYTSAFITSDKLYTISNHLQ